MPRASAKISQNPEAPSEQFSNEQPQASQPMVRELQFPGVAGVDGPFKTNPEISVVDALCEAINLLQSAYSLLTPMAGNDEAVNGCRFLIGAGLTLIESIELEIETAYS